MKIMNGCVFMLACLVGGQALAEPLGGRRLLPDWERTGPLVMVWPEHVRGGRPYIPLYIELIQALPADLEPALAGPKPPDRAHLQAMGRNVRYLPVSALHDRNLLDWSGWPVVEPNGLLVAGTFTYPPQHITGRERARAAQDARAARELAALLYGRDDPWPVTMMGTLWVHNGSGMALVSNRLVAENETWSLSSLNRLFSTRGGIHHVVFIPVPPGETAGRIDGLVRFLDPDTLLVAVPPETSTHAHQFSRDLVADLTETLGDTVTVVPVPIAASDWSSPWENDLHFIRAGSYLLLPEYGETGPTPLRKWLAHQRPNLQVQGFPLPGEERRRLQDTALNRLVVRY